MAGTRGFRLIIANKESGQPIRVDLAIGLPNPSFLNHDRPRTHSLGIATPTGLLKMHLKLSGSLSSPVVVCSLSLAYWDDQCTFTMKSLPKLVGRSLVGGSEARRRCCNFSLSS